MTTELSRYIDAAHILVPVDAAKDRRHRLAKFAHWLTGGGRLWHKPDLAAYRDHLLSAGYAPSTVSAHLSTVRGRYAELARDRDCFYAIAAQQTDDLLERKAIVDEVIQRIENAIDPKAAKVTLVAKQDVADSEYLRLTKRQAEALISAPGVDTLLGLRDTALIATLLCTGIREAELAALDVDDLRQRFGGELALRVREGKGARQRLIPYGALSWILAVLDKWTETVGISEGAVFRGFYRGGRLRPGRLSVRQVQNTMKRYPVMVAGRLVTVQPHDCRRTYARRLYEAGTDTLAIQQNLGHAQLKTTLNYIGTLDAKKRRPPAVYCFDLAKLASVPVQGRLT